MHAPGTRTQQLLACEHANTQAHLVPARSSCWHASAYMLPHPPVSELEEMSRCSRFLALTMEAGSVPVRPVPPMPGPEGRGGHVRQGVQVWAKSCTGPGPGLHAKKRRLAIQMTCLRSCAAASGARPHAHHQAGRWRPRPAAPGGRSAASWAAGRSADCLREETQKFSSARKARICIVRVWGL